MHIASLFINTGVVWLALEFLQKRFALRFQFPEKYFLRICKGALAFLIVTAIFYVGTPSYFNYIESSLANVSQYWIKGHPLYTDLFSQDRYSLLYGPWSFIINGLYQLPNIAVIQASKKPGLLNLLLTLFMFWILLRRLSLSFEQKILAIGTLCLSFLGFDNFSYVNRPDSFLITYVVGALLALEWEKGTPFFSGKERRTLFWVIAGILMGLSIACKIHGFIYFFPIFIFFFEKRKKKISLIHLVAVGILGTGVSFLPFFLPNISFNNYLTWLTLTSKHGLTFRLFTDNLTYVFPYMLCLYYLGFTRRYKKTFLALCLSLLAMCILGSLVGAGTHHLLPFLPLIVYFGALSYFSDAEKRKTEILVTSLLMALSYDAFISQKAIFNYFGKIPTQLSQFQEIRNFQEKYSGPIELGYGDNSQLELSYFKPYILAHGGSLLVDASALMDMGFSGIEIPPATLKALDECSTPFIILPKGETQWQGISGFGVPLFSEQWKHIFSEKYKAVEGSRFYTLYKCRK